MATAENEEAADQEEVSIVAASEVKVERCMECEGTNYNLQADGNYKCADCKAVSFVLDTIIYYRLTVRRASDERIIKFNADREVVDAIGQVEVCRPGRNYNITTRDNKVTSLVQVAKVPGS